MPDKELRQIKISRLIPAQKWRIMRLLTKVWEFPAYVHSVKEAAVIDKTNHRMITKWRVEVDGVPISWIEEDRLAIAQDAIYFEAIEGDLEEFRGEWKFRSLPEGTEVSVTVDLKVGIPGIKDFADNYVEKILRRNFEAILEALENRLISIRYASYKKGDIQKVAGFGVLGHFYNFNHLVKCLKTLNPVFKTPSKEFLTKLFHMTPSFKMYEMGEFKSKTGDVTHGCFILCTFIPEMIDEDVYAVYSKVIRACKVAEKQGVGVVSLGGFTSIVGERLGHQVSEEVDIPITTGNTYTAALAIEGVEKAAEALDRDLKDLCLTVVGGTGDIGSACAKVLTEKVEQLTITGRTKSNLSRISKELAKKHKAKIIATTDNQAAVRDADIVIAAASVSSAILDVNWFKPGAIICDLGYPKNISYAPVERKDILVFSGGLASVPMPIDTGVDMGLPSTDVSYGCFSEAIILALEKRFENYSYGRGNIMPEKIEEIKKLGLRHGFGLAPFYWANRLIEAGEFEQLKKI